MEQENVELVRRLFAQLASSVDVDEVDSGLSDAALEQFFDPEVEWVPVQQSLLASERYHGYEGVRRFWAAFLSVWDEYLVEPEEVFAAAGQVVAVMRMSARTHDLEIEEIWSSLYAFREGRILRIHAFASRDGARQAADQPD